LVHALIEAPESLLTYLNHENRQRLIGLNLWCNDLSLTMAEYAQPKYAQLVPSYEAGAEFNPVSSFRAGRRFITASICDNHLRPSCTASVADFG
jgi:hypothetical protein